MNLNDVHRGVSKHKQRKRLGRGPGSGHGKTCGKGHKGQRSRSGGYHKVGFEGGQMPLQRRLPKFGFHSRMARYSAEVRLHELGGLDAEIITLQTLIDANIVPRETQKAKIIKSGEINKSVRLQGISATAGAKEAIEAAGGKVEA